MIINGDSLHELKNLEDKSVDAVITDPPYGYSFMGKDWDKAVPSVEIWRECLRVLKPGGWCMVMSAPRSDVQNAMISRLVEAGFRLDFTPIYWSYASGFPKAGNVGKLVDKRMGAEREVSEVQGQVASTMGSNTMDGGKAQADYQYTKATSDQAKALDGSYTGFQPKPAVEVVIVAMKPLSEKTYVDQALKNGKGITWLDDCRVPTEPADAQAQMRALTPNSSSMNGSGGVFKGHVFGAPTENFVSTEWSPSAGRFPANLLVSDEALNSHSKYFDLDAWADTLPFLAVPKASKSEKNKGLEHLQDKITGTSNGNSRKCKKCGHYFFSGTPCTCAEPDWEIIDKVYTAKNNHPTVKPLKLMSYLITLTTREGDTVLDPFVGSGTTVVAAKQLGRKGVGIEREEEYAEIARGRVEAVNEAEEQLSLV